MSSIRPVTLDDVVGLDRYETIRDDLRRRIIALKRHRRVSVGDEVTLVFENHDTVFFQIQEMLRAERITDLDAVREELAVYNGILPRPGELSATMLIEVTQEVDIPRRLLALLGIDEAVRIEVGREHVVRAEFEPGRSKEDKLSAVQYVRFPFSAAARDGFLGDMPVWLVVDHPNYAARAAIEGGLRDSLRADLANAHGSR
jgi:hypothetical protein